MQVEAEFVGQRFQTAGEIVDVRESAESNLHRTRCRVDCARGLGMVIVPVVVAVVSPMVADIQMRDDIMRVGMDDIMVILSDDMSMTVANDVVMMVEVVAGRVMVVAVMVMLSAGRSGDYRAQKQSRHYRDDGLHECLQVDDKVCIPARKRPESPLWPAEASEPERNITNNRTQAVSVVSGRDEVYPAVWEFVSRCSA